MDDVGPVEAATRADVEAMELNDTISGSYSEIAFNLARKLDKGAGMATAAVAKELRETLAQLREVADDNSSDFITGLSSPVRNGA